MATGSGTGSPATPPTSITANQLIDDAIRLAIADTTETEFSDSVLLSFLNEAIKEYTQHLPRLGTFDITTIALNRSYPLPTSTRAVINVEFPAGASPATLIPRLNHRRADFYRAEHYDYIPTFDLTIAPIILLSFDPPAGDTIRVSYQYEHDHHLALGDDITVPADHHHILIQYCIFAATRQQQAREESNPTSANSLLMSQYASNTRRYELAYLNALNRILFHRRGQSQTAAWHMDN